MSFSDGTLIINGESRREEKEGGHWVRHERRVGKYVRSLHLRESVDPKNISARYEDGVLELTIPKPKKTEAQTIAVN